MRVGRRLAATAAFLSTTTTAIAHQGHGAAGVHWHATDTAGFVAVAVLAGVAIWLSRKD
jgi:hypothetical protein